MKLNHKKSSLLSHLSSLKGMSERYKIHSKKKIRFLKENNQQMQERLEKQNLVLDDQFEKIRKGDQVVLGIEPRERPKTIQEVGNEEEEWESEIRKSFNNRSGDLEEAGDNIMENQLGVVEEQPSPGMDSENIGLIHGKKGSSDENLSVDKNGNFAGLGDDKEDNSDDEYQTIVFSKQVDKRNPGIDSQVSFYTFQTRFLWKQTLRYFE